MSSRRSRLLLFGGLYFAQGVPWGFVTVALALRLTAQGLSSSGLGSLLFLATLPWMGKPIIGLLVDRISFGAWGRRRPFILIAQSGMALTLLAMATCQANQPDFLFSALLFVHNLLAATQDVGTDALAIDLLAEDERARGNGIMSAGKYAGVMVGGQGLLWVANTWGWSVAFASAAILLLLPAALVLSVREHAAPTQPPRLFREAALSFSSRAALIGVLFALLVHTADSLTFPLVYPLFQRQLGFGQQQVALLATVGTLVAAIGALLGGVLADRWGCRRALVAGSLCVAILNAAFAAARILWPHYSVLLTYTILGSLATGVVYSSTLALFMNLTNPRLAATQFQIYMALLNAKDAWALRAGGGLADRVAAPTMFGLSAICEVAPLVLLTWIARKKRAAGKMEEEGVAAAG